MPPTGNGQSIRERAANGVGPDPQMEINEKQVENPDLEAALEAREAAREKRLSAQSDFKAQDTVVKGHLSTFQLAVGEVARVGRFKIKKTMRRGTSVSFETAPREQLSIEVDG